MCQLWRANGGEGAYMLDPVARLTTQQFVPQNLGNRGCEIMACNFIMRLAAIQSIAQASSVPVSL